jgi:epoxyqueuosine reductase
LTSRTAASYPELIRELSLPPERFNQKFKQSPIRRARRRGYLRNVAVALGNTGDPAAVPVLIDALFGDVERLVRGHAAWALGKIGGGTAGKGLGDALRMEQDEYVLGEIHSAIKEMSS